MNDCFKKKSHKIWQYLLFAIFSLVFLNIHEVGAAKNGNGTLDFYEESILSARRGIMAGGMGQYLGRFTLQETSGAGDVMIKKIVFINEGSLRNSNFSNLKLKVGDDIITQAPTINKSEIIFYPNYLKVNENAKKTITVYGDIKGGVGETVDLQLEKIVVNGVEYCASSFSGTNISELNEITDRKSNIAATSRVLSKPAVITSSVSSKSKITTKTNSVVTTNNSTSKPPTTPVVVEKKGLKWPIVGHVNYKFHDPNYLYNSLHQGIDIQANQGTNVRAAQSGTVTTVVHGSLNAYSYVVIDHGNGFKTVYGHLSQINVTVGQIVSVSEIIGKSGGTPGTQGSGPNTNGPHLHFEVIKDGVYVDPEMYLL